MSYNPEGCGSMGLEALLNSNFSVFPIPSTNKLFAQINGETIHSYELTAMDGKMFHKGQNLNLAVLELNTSNYPSGAYLLNVHTAKGSVQKKIIID